MKRIYVNFKRFDVPDGLGGVNGLFAPQDWAAEMLRNTRATVDLLAAHGAACTFFFPEAHVLPAIVARGEHALPRIGCQGVYFEDVAEGGNFGAFTAARPAAAAKALGCESVLIGHCEERRGYLRVLAEAGIQGSEAARAVNRLLAREVECAARRGLPILYC
ncbi:MAG TPA: triose-phosphate isomerase, partial [Clostridia bacterium]|nr:triose-phosphate isomerase [Clostridia bacterium]